MPKDAKLSKSSIDDALSAWTKIIGSENVITDKAALSEHERATFKTDNSVAAVLLPKNRAEVQECVRIANEYRTPLYPISKGRNWGYGSRVPAKDGCVIISLERLNNIVNYNEDLGYITVEPGVTFGQVFNFLKEKNSKLLPPSIGSTSEASLVGNALERGIGKGTYGDRFQFSCDMEVVLPTGEYIETGFGHIDKAFSKNVYRWGVGPSLDGIFTQSNFGIVTRMTFWLARKPGYFQAIFYTVNNDEQLGRVVDALRQLRLEGTLTTTSTLSNDYRILSMKSQFPWKDIKDEDKALPEEYIERLRQGSLRGARWVGDDAILAPNRSIGAARRRRVKQVLGRATENVIFIDSTKAKIFKLLWKPIKKYFGVDLRELMFFFYNSIYLGIPMEKQLSICYWRKKTPMPEKINPDADRCGVIWCSPSVPFQSKHVKKVLGILEGIFKKYEFEPNIGLNFMSDRSIAFTAAVIYDRDTPGHDEKAMKCYKEIHAACLEEGYPPYRLGVQSMDDVITDSPEYSALLGKIKHQLDPNNIISPGHYGINGRK